jgi:pimeloyl-ACP methyl ester carboxylesterase
MNHFSERKLKPNNDTDRSWVIWSRHEPIGAVVFVHGFRGQATSTWTSFESLLPPRGKAKHYDIFFYGYNCFSSDTTVQGRLFCDFLHELCTSPDRLAKDSLPTAAAREREFRYERVLLVGHSIGAIVCRRALLYARKLGRDWMPNTSMILFAPADHGARVGLLKDLPDWSWLYLIKTALRYVSPLVDEVEPSSESIRRLQQDSSDAIKDGAKYLIANKVILAEMEHVIDNQRFVQDPVPIPIPGTTHTTVCKPRPDFTQPIDEVEQGL